MYYAHERETHQTQGVSETAPSGVLYVDRKKNGPVGFGVGAIELRLITDQAGRMNIENQKSHSRYCVCVCVCACVCVCVWVGEGEGGCVCVHCGIYNQYLNLHQTPRLVPIPLYVYPIHIAIAMHIKKRCGVVCAKYFNRDPPTSLYAVGKCKPGCPLVAVTPIHHSL